MIPKNCIWLFISDVPSAAFTSKNEAEQWIQDNKLSGVLTAFPLDKSCFDWAVENDALSVRAEKIEEKKANPQFIASCLPASLAHFHYHNGIKD